MRIKNKRFTRLPQPFTESLTEALGLGEGMYPVRMKELKELIEKKAGQLFYPYRAFCEMYGENDDPDIPLDDQEIFQFGIEICFQCQTRVFRFIQEVTEFTENLTIEPRDEGTIRNPKWRKWRK